MSWHSDSIALTIVLITEYMPPSFNLRKRFGDSFAPMSLNLTKYLALTMQVQLYWGRNYLSNSEVHDSSFYLTKIKIVRNYSHFRVSSPLLSWWCSERLLRYCLCCRFWWLLLLSLVHHSIFALLLSTRQMGKIRHFVAVCDLFFRSLHCKCSTPVFTSRHLLGVHFLTRQNSNLCAYLTWIGHNKKCVLSRTHKTQLHLSLTLLC